MLAFLSKNNLSRASYLQQPARPDLRRHQTDPAEGSVRWPVTPGADRLDGCGLDWSDEVGRDFVGDARANKETLHPKILNSYFRFGAKMKSDRTALFVRWGVAGFVLLAGGLGRAAIAAENLADTPCDALARFDIGCDTASMFCDDMPPGCDGFCEQDSDLPIGYIDQALAQWFPVASEPFVFDVLYTNDVMRNDRGGIQTGGVGTGLLDVVMFADLDLLGLEAIGGTLVLHGQNKHGGVLQQRVGASQSTNIDAEPFTAMAEYFWEQTYFGDAAVVRIGRQVGAIQFSILDPAADFLYGGFVISPNNPLPWFPNPTVAITGNLQLTETIDIGGGSFNGGPPDQLSPWGWSEDGRVYSLVELTCRYDIAGLPGDIQNGLWYTSGSHDDIFGGAAHSGNNGYYFGIDQQFWSEPANPDQGFAAFFIYSWAPEDRNVINRHYAAGCVYRGLLPGRDEDVVGVGVSTVDWSDEVARPETETVIEAFYKTWFAGDTLVQPVVQFIDNPNGLLEDSLAFGMRLGWEL